MKITVHLLLDKGMIYVFYNLPVIFFTIFITMVVREISMYGFWQFKSLEILLWLLSSRMQYHPSYSFFFFLLKNIFDSLIFLFQVVMIIKLLFAWLILISIKFNASARNLTRNLTHSVTIALVFFFFLIHCYGKNLERNDKTKENKRWLLHSYGCELRFNQQMERTLNLSSLEIARIVHSHNLWI